MRREAPNSDPRYAIGASRQKATHAMNKHKAPIRMGPKIGIPYASAAPAINNGTSSNNT